MNTLRLRPVVRILSAAVLLQATTALAAVFDAPYELTLPAATGYINPVNGTTFGGAPGQWSVSGVSGVAPDQWSVNTSLAPDSLQLSVIDFAGAGGIGVTFDFLATAVAPGSFSFAFTAAYGLNAPHIYFMQAGVPVATDPVSGSFTFTLAGTETFGFRLQATEGAVADQATLTIVPEPHSALLLAFGAHARARRRRG